MKLNVFNYFMAKYTTEKIIEQFRSIHGNRYDYSLVDYQGDKSKVKIICKDHGEFKQWVGVHKKGSGCKKCFLSSIKPRGNIEQLLVDFRKVHGDKFDYSLVEYVHSQKKVKIICRTHGVFEQHIAMHRKGQGCAKCMYDGKRHLLGDVIHKFNEIHDGKYDYSQAIYVNTDTKIKIICPNHGVFEQAAEKHLHGNGCPKCIGRHKTQEEIITEFTLVHGRTYDYRKVKLVSVNSKVMITCFTHGDFNQNPSNHLNGQGCPKCAGTSKLSLGEVIEQFRLTHGKLYDYSLVKYKNSKTKIEVVCKEHGVFEQSPGSHKRGNGCPICAGNYNLDTNTIIEQFKETHGDRYDYSCVNYTRAFGNIQIICPEHGVFLQTARSHKRGSGCPDCAVTIGHTKSSYIEYCDLYNGKTHLYLIECSKDNELFYKIGISRLGANERFNTRRKMPYKFKVLKEIYGDASAIWDLEKSLHISLSLHKYKPSIDFHGKTECFLVIDDNVFELINNFIGN